jgi:hypothetical protein
MAARAVGEGARRNLVPSRAPQHHSRTERLRGHLPGERDHPDDVNRHFPNLAQVGIGRDRWCRQVDLDGGAENGSHVERPPDHDSRVKAHGNTLIRIGAMVIATRNSHAQANTIESRIAQPREAHRWHRLTIRLPQFDERDEAPPDRMQLRFRRIFLREIGLICRMLEGVR